MTSEQRQYLAECRDCYRRTLVDDVMPFWLKHGLDKVNGGVYTCLDRDGKLMDSTKSVWFQGETIIASLYAYKLTGDDKYLEIHRKANDWAFEHFADKEYGEWYGYLHRDGTVAQPAKGNIFKGPFHVPRMLIKASLLCDEILK